MIKTLKIWNDLAKNDIDLKNYLNILLEKYNFNDIYNKIIDVSNEDIIRVSEDIFMTKDVNNIFTFTLNLINNDDKNKMEIVKSIFNRWDIIAKSNSELLDILEDIKSSNEIISIGL